MKIPKRFKIMAHTIEVVNKDSLLSHERLYGTTNSASNIIELESKDIEKQVKAHTFMHELTHVILNNMGEHELSSNEKFVDVFSGLLHQAIETMEF